MTDEEADEIKKTNEGLDLACRESLDKFFQRSFREVEPGTPYEWNWHIGCVAEHLEAMFNGEIQRLIINEPPRFLKSFKVARSFPAWVMGKVPTEKFISTSYGESVAEQNAIHCRRIMGSAWYKRIFPKTIVGAQDFLDRNMHFQTDMSGHYYAATALSPITGIGCNYMIIDDPLKPMEALSDTIRVNTNRNIRGTLFSRFNDKRVGKFLLIMQRLHEDDPTGNLLQDGGYVHLKLPAEAKRPVLITLNGTKWTMKKDELLFPGRINKTILDQDLLDMGPYNYAGQMLQEPVPLAGGELREAWVNYYDAGSIRPKGMNIYILVDASGGAAVNKKKKKLSDWTAMMVVGTADDNNYYLLDVVRDRLNPTDRINKLFELHRKWNDLGGKAPKVGYEEYGLMTDIHYIKQKMNEDTYHFPLVKLAGRMAKEERIRRLIPDMQTGRWYFPPNLMYIDTEGRQFDLIRELVKSEIPSFPLGRFDDMIDAMSRIKDEDLFVVFPKVKQSKVQNVIEKSRRNRGVDSWENY